MPLNCVILIPTCRAKFAARTQPFAFESVAGLLQPSLHLPATTPPLISKVTAFNSLFPHQDKTTKCVRNDAQILQTSPRHQCSSDLAS